MRKIIEAIRAALDAAPAGTLETMAAALQGVRD